MAVNEQLRVVVHFKDGSIVKGYTQDFTPPKQTFNLSPPEYDTKNATEISMSDLKALFFVKTFEGNNDYIEKTTFDDVKTFGLPGLKVKVEFSDGEIIRGMTFDYRNIFNGFFMIPADPKGNNEKVYIITDPPIDISIGSLAET